MNKPFYCIECDSAFIKVEMCAIRSCMNKRLWHFTIHDRKPNNNSTYVLNTNDKVHDKFIVLFIRAQDLVLNDTRAICWPVYAYDNLECKTQDAILTVAKSYAVFRCFFSLPAVLPEWYDLINPIMSQPSIMVNKYLLNLGKPRSQYDKIKKGNCFLSNAYNIPVHS